MTTMSVPFNDLARFADGEQAEIGAAIDEVIGRGWFVGGPEVEGFEQEFGAHGGLPWVVAVANGTDALELSLRAVGVGRGDDVIVATNAGGYGSVAARLVGATPVFVDVDPTTLLVTAQQVAAATTATTKAVICTHLYGSVVDLTPIRAALPAAVAVIEDCAQAHGATIDGRPVGTIGDLAAFSFYPTKNLGALGDAGAVATTDETLATRVRRLAQYGWDERFHAVTPAGRNSRMDEVQAAILRRRLRRLDDATARRAAILRRYADSLGGILEFPERRAGSVAHLAVGACDGRDHLRRALADAGIGTGVHYPTPDHRQPGLTGDSSTTSLPVAERACGRVVSLPLFPGLAEREIDTVCAAVERWGRDAR
ncbi:MAG: DegT/DnrJ/EryC1/StrS family aminotransferase [Desertimonas sp.]